jgi:hypothetical protein
MATPEYGAPGLMTIDDYAQLPAIPADHRLCYGPEPVDREFKRYFCHSARWSQPREARRDTATAARTTRSGCSSEVTCPSGFFLGPNAIFYLYSAHMWKFKLRAIAAHRWAPRGLGPRRPILSRHNALSCQGSGMASVQLSGRIPNASMQRCQPEPTDRAAPSSSSSRPCPQGGACGGRG